MFLTGRGGYNRDGEQVAGGLFLMVAGGHEYMLDHDDLRSHMVKLPLRAAVRHVRLGQLGHWMMGSAALGSTRVTVSGAYGDDGLPMSPGKFWEQYQRMVPLPPELERAFWAGGGHNTSGDEGPALRAWALRNLETLRKAGR